MATTTPPHYDAQQHHGDPSGSDAGYTSREYGSGPGSRPNSYLADTSIVPTEFHVRNGTSVTSPSPGAGPGTGPDGLNNNNPGQPSRFHEELMSRRASSMMDGHASDDTPRAESQASMAHSASASALPSRTNTLKKKPSMSRKGSLRRGGSRKSSRAGSVRSVNLGEKEKYAVTDHDLDSVFYVPIPTNGNPTEILANRFQAWRKVLKDLIGVFRDIQRSYENRSKMLVSASNAMGNITMPTTFLISGGISDATDILKDYHRRALLESNKAKEVEAEIVVQLNGLRNDLQQKSKEIKALSADFKNSVDKEIESTRKSVRQLHEALGLVDSDAAATSGKGDPFIIKTGVDRQVEKQMEEENYLHRAYLNLESSGRELESIVVGEIQKAYNAYASILKRDADTAYDTVDRLRDGPISMPKDHEWNAFVSQNEQLIDPNIPVRSVETIMYPGKDHPAAAEVRCGMLERKSKYLKSYTPGWYVLSPTHLHEFKSSDRTTSNALVMSLYLPEQKLGSHSQPESSSHKFILKGRQTGAMHRGHAWVFRAESHDTMLAWYEDIKNLTEKTGEARNAFVKRHAHSLSGSSYRASIDSERALMEDEADAVPYTANSHQHQHIMSNHNNTRDSISGDGDWQQQQQQRRSQPGGRFPSEIQASRLIRSPSSPSSGKRSEDRTVPPPSSRVGAPGLEASYGEQVPNNYNYNYNTNRTSMVDGAEGDGRYSKDYGDWMAPLPHRHSSQHQHRQQPPNSEHHASGLRNNFSTPPPQEQPAFSEKQQQPRIHSSASTAVVNPDDGGRYQNTDPTTTTAYVNSTTAGESNNAPRRTTSSRSRSRVLDTDHQPDNVEGGGGEDDDDEEITRSASGSTSRKSLGLSRASTGDIKVPGMFPVNSY